MRDPARIDQVLSVIREIWIEDPDLRLGQLLMNAARLSDPEADLFCIEDTVLVRKLETLAKRTRRDGPSSLPDQEAAS
jgi:uncharacterized protein YihD (DUF1040 family)